MGFWNDWGLSLIMVIAVAAFITSQLVERWVDGQEEIGTRNLEADES